MYFTSLKLQNFRNYKEEYIKFHPKVNIIRGDNAQGKTNILEALFILSLGKSFRTNKDSEMIRFGQEFSSVKSTYVKDNTERTIEVILADMGKSVIIDGYKIKKSSELLDNIYIVAFTPEDMKIVKDEPERRRRFIDRELSQLKPVYYKYLQRYKKSLIQRNALLKQGCSDEGLMEIWEKNLAEYGCRIVAERKKFIDKIEDISKGIHKNITEGREDLELSYESSISYKESIDELEIIFLNKLKKERAKDLYRGTTRFGPHRDDLKISIGGIDVRNFGSQGQQRTAALSLKLAEVEIIKKEKAISPILLLDDVLSELDEKRQEFLIKSFTDLQLFVTTAEEKQNLLDKLGENKEFQISGGHCIVAS